MRMCMGIVYIQICPVRLGVACPLVLREGYQGKACLHICSLSPGAPRRTPGEDFVRLGVVCPLVYSVRSARERLYVWCSLSHGLL